MRTLLAEWPTRRHVATVLLTRRSRLVGRCLERVLLRCDRFGRLGLLDAQLAQTIGDDAIELSPLTRGLIHRRAGFAARDLAKRLQRFAENSERIALRHL